jgi:hypothetical protein
MFILEFRVVNQGNRLYNPAYIFLIGVASDGTE